MTSSPVSGPTESPRRRSRIVKTLIASFAISLACIAPLALYEVFLGVGVPGFAWEMDVISRRLLDAFGCGVVLFPILLGAAAIYRRLRPRREGNTPPSPK